MSEADKLAIQGNQIRIKELEDQIKRLKGEVSTVRIANIVYTKGDLEKLKMEELRRIGNLIDAKDTSKNELILEILIKGEIV